MKKFLAGFAALFIAAVLAFCTLDIGTGFIAEWGADYVAKNYDVGVTIGKATGNPVKGYEFNNIELTQDGRSLIKAAGVTVKPVLSKIITGNVALDHAEISRVTASIPDLLALAKLFTGAQVTLPKELPISELVINKIGGTVSDGTAKGSFDLAVNGLPLTGDFDVSFADELSASAISISLCGGTVSVTGEVLPRLSLQAKASGISVSDLAPLVSQISDLAVRGTVDAELEISGTAEAPTVVGTVSFSNGVAFGFPISASSSISFRDMMLTLEPLTATAMGIPAGGTVLADLSGEEPSLKVDVKSEGAVTADVLRKNFTGIPDELAGQIDTFSVSLAGPVNSLSGAALVRADRLTLGSQAITGTSFKADFGDGGRITFSGGSDIAGNPASLMGTANIGGEQVSADVAVSVTDFDLSVLPKLVSAAPENMKGKVTAALTVKGTGSNITAGGKVSSSNVTLNDMSVDKINVPFSFESGVVSFNDASFSFMDLPVTKVNGSITMGGSNIAFKEMSAIVAGGQVKMDSVLEFGKNLNGSYDLSISDIDLGSVMKTFGAGDLGASGKFAGHLKGAISDTDITGDGSVSIPAFTLNGLKATDIKSSVKLSKMVATLPDFSAKFAEGTVRGSASVDINNMSYSLKATLDGSQLKSVITQAAPALGGGLTGKLTGDYSASGKLNPFSLSGSGTVTSSGGKLYGFDKYKSYIDLAAKLHGSKEVSYANAKILFDTDLSKLTLKKGTVINAESGDGIYQYIKANGTFAYTGALNIDVEGSINAMLVNTAASALSGAATAGGTAALLTGGTGGIAGLIAGAATGASSYGKADFHTLSFNVGGTVDSPKFSNFKENGKTWTASSNSSESTASGNSTTDAINSLKDTISGKSSSSSEKSTSTSTSTKTSSSSKKSSSSKSNTSKQLGNVLGNLLNK